MEPFSIEVRNPRNINRIISNLVFSNNMSGLSSILFSLLRFICIHCLNDHLPHCLYCPFILNSEHSIPHLRVAHTHTFFFFLFWWTYYAKKRSLEGWWSIIKDLVLYIWRHLSNIKWWNICRFVLYYPAHVCNHELPPFPLLFFFSPPTLFFFPSYYDEHLMPKNEAWKSGG